MTVADFLAAAKAAHVLAQNAAARVVATGGSISFVASDPVSLQAHWQAAYDARMAADGLDPTHSDPAWANDDLTPLHAALLKFYRLQLGLDQPVVCP